MLKRHADLVYSLLLIAQASLRALKKMKYSYKRTKCLSSEKYVSVAMALQWCSW